VYDTLKKILVETLRVEPSQVRPDATKDDLELDSLGVVELAMVLEKDHGLLISDEELQGVDTVADIVALMEQRSVAS
jgi:acyl carrier protein